ncbi:unnamed protein product [Gadus morhua 'NCC']
MRPSVCERELCSCPRGYVHTGGSSGHRGRVIGCTGDPPSDWSAGSLFVLSRTPPAPLISRQRRSEQLYPCPTI